MNRTAIRRLGAISTAVVLAVALSGCGIFHGKGGPKTPTVGNRVPILSRIEAGTSVDASLASVAVVVPPPQVNADWSQAGGTASKSYGHLALGDHPNELWNEQIPGSGKKRRLAAAPVVGNGTLFVMDTDGVVDAFDAATGRSRWHYKMPVSRAFSTARVRSRTPIFDRMPET